MPRGLANGVCSALQTTDRNALKPANHSKNQYEMVTPGRFELPTRSLGNCCSIHLSYGATALKLLFVELPLRISGLIEEIHLRMVTDRVTGWFSPLTAPRSNQPTCKGMKVAMPLAVA